MSGLKPRDKIELVVATAVLGTWLYAFEITGMAGDPTWPTRLLVLAAAFTMFGDNVAKARDLIRDNHGDTQ